VRAAVLCASGENGVDQGYGSDVGRGKRSRFRRGHKKLIAFFSERRKVSIGNADAIGAVGSRLLDSLDGLAKAAAEGYADSQIFLTERAREMHNAARGTRRKNRKSEKANLIFQIFGEQLGEVTGKDDDAARFIKTLGQCRQALRIETVLEALQIF
jgi:hypothetical protein